VIVSEEYERFLELWDDPRNTMERLNEAADRVISLPAAGGAAEADGAPGAGDVRSSGEYPRWTCRRSRETHTDGDGG
jgi:hypothetical protein